MKMPVSMDFKLKIFDHCVFEKVNPPLGYTDVSFEERENGSNGCVGMCNTEVAVIPIPFFVASLASCVPTLIASSKSFSCSFTKGLMNRW